MGEIRKDNLHESLIEELNELANIDLSGKQDKTDESLLTESKDVIGAINELFQSANNGKELIANAIGEPLNSEDTFSAMSSDINSLLSTFKTNMMNNGITVNSGDKFKSLIDKIATMVEEGSGKGIQFASGTVSASSQIRYVLLQGTNGHTSNSGYLVEITSLSFKPMIVLLANSNDTPVVSAYNNECFINFEDGYRKMEMATLTSSVANVTNLKLLDNGFRLATKKTGLYTYYAIGVGEEDTTLRDSLASILTEEGVSVTEEDDMASLISKVDEEFTKDNNTINTLNTDKTNLTNQITSKNNEINNNKQQLVNILTSKGISCSTNNSFNDLLGNVNNNIVKKIPLKSTGGIQLTVLNETLNWNESSAVGSVKTTTYNVNIKHDAFELESAIFSIFYKSAGYSYPVDITVILERNGTTVQTIYSQKTIQTTNIKGNKINIPNIKQGDNIKISITKLSGQTGGTTVFAVTLQSHFDW